MSKIFDLDSPLMQFLTLVANLLIVNVLTILCCIPIFTVGASLSAMHYILLKMARHEEGYIVKSFFHGFKENFKQATGEWLLNLVLFLILGSEAYMMYKEPSVFPRWLMVAVVAALIFLFFAFQWVFPLQMHFINPVKTTLKNCLLIGLANFPRTLLMGIVWAIPVAVTLLGGWRLLPLVIMFGLSVPGYLMAKVYSPVFKRFEPEEEEPAADEDFSLDGLKETQQAIQDTASASANPDIESRHVVLTQADVTPLPGRDAAAQADGSEGAGNPDGDPAGSGEPGTGTQKTALEAAETAPRAEESGAGEN